MYFYFKFCFHLCVFREEVEEEIAKLIAAVEKTGQRGMQILQTEFKECVSFFFQQ